MRAIVPVVIVLVLTAAAAGVIAAEADPAIAVVAPNPVPTDNEGEFLVIDVPPGTNVSGWTIVDHHHEATLPNTTVDGRVAVSARPSLTELLVDEDVLGVSGRFRPAADGDRLELRDADGTRLDRVTYGSTPQGVRWHRTDAGELVARTPGQTDHAPVAVDVDEAEAFVLPDGAAVPDAVLASAKERLFLAGYELSDPAAVDQLVERADDGVDVRVLVDGEPVGGQSAEELEALDRLVAANVSVRVLTGSRDRFRFHHPKYAVADDRAIVMTENWKRAGTGGASSRGWGVVVTDRSFSDELAALFHADAGWRDGVAWERARLDATGVDGVPPNRTHPVTHEPAPVAVEAAELVVAPDAAEPRLRELIADADESIAVQQVRIADPDFPLLEEVFAAAERGVSVQIQLDSSWYVAEENRAVAAAIEERAAAARLPVEVRLVEETDRFEKIHTKGLVVDDEVVVVGSMNWNNVSMRDNREVMVVLHGEAAAGYYGAVFAADWTPVGINTPVGLVLAAVAVWTAVGATAVRYVEFAPAKSS